MVLMGLAFASVVTWTVWLAKTIEIFFAKSTCCFGTVRGFYLAQFSRKRWWCGRTVSRLFIESGA